MWNPQPYIDVLTQLAPEPLRGQEQLSSFIEDIVLDHGQRRPEFVQRALPDIAAARQGFVYDRGSGLVFFSDWADHERTAATLMVLHDLAVLVDWNAAREQPLRRHGQLADRYLEDGYGFIANSPHLSQASGCWPLNVGSEVVLSSQERQWFHGLEVQYR